jgi:hypothetical protein
VLASVLAVGPVGRGHRARNAAGVGFTPTRRGRATAAGHLACSADAARPFPGVGRPRLAANRLPPLCARHARGAGRCATRRAEHRPSLPLRGRGSRLALHPIYRVKSYVAVAVSSH